jgi:hypothetical protein
VYRKAVRLRMKEAIDYSLSRRRRRSNTYRTNAHTRTSHTVAWVLLYYDLGWVLFLHHMLSPLLFKVNISTRSSTASHFKYYYIIYFEYYSQTVNSIPHSNQCRKTYLLRWLQYRYCNAPAASASLLSSHRCNSSASHIVTSHPTARHSSHSSSKSEKADFKTGTKGS